MTGFSASKKPAKTSAWKLQQMVYGLNHSSLCKPITWQGCVRESALTVHHQSVSWWPRLVQGSADYCCRLNRRLDNNETAAGTESATRPLNPGIWQGLIMQGEPDAMLFLIIVMYAQQCSWQRMLSHLSVVNNPGGRGIWGRAVSRNARTQKQLKV